MLFWLCSLVNYYALPLFLWYKLIDNLWQIICMYCNNRHIIKHVVCISNTHRMEETTVAFYYEWYLKHTNNRHLIAATVADAHNSKTLQLKSKPGWCHSLLNACCPLLKGTSTACCSLQNPRLQQTGPWPFSKPPDSASKGAHGPTQCPLHPVIDPCGLSFTLRVFKWWISPKEPRGPSSTLLLCKMGMALSPLRYPCGPSLPRCPATTNPQP